MFSCFLYTGAIVNIVKQVLAFEFFLYSYVTKIKLSFAFVLLLALMSSLYSLTSIFKL